MSVMRISFRVILMLVFCCALTHIGRSQTTFEKTYGGTSDERAFSVNSTTDKGFIMAGYTDSYGVGDNDFYVIKTDSAGNAIWAKTYGGAHDDEAYAAQQTTDGGYIIAGYSNSFGATNYDAYLVKTNAQGDTLWTRTYGGGKDDYANAIQQTADGGYVFSGYTTSFVSSPDSGNIYLVKTDVNGNLSWSKSLGATLNISDGYSVRQTADKGYIITGYTNGFGEPNGDAFLFKTDSMGTVSWTKTYGSPGLDWGNSVKQTNDGGYIVAGSSSFDSTNLIDVYVIKTNAIGDTLWTKTYGGAGYDFGQTIEQTTDGGYIITGYTNTCDTCNYNVYLIKTDANGNLLWSNTNGGSGDDEGNSVYQTNDGGYIIAGLTSSFGAGNYNFYLLKTDANGNSCNQTNSNNTMKNPATMQSNQTMRTYTTNTQVHNVNTLIDTGNVITNACYSAGIKYITENQPFINLFPNPNNGTFTISCNSTSKDNLIVSIENNLGENMYTKTILSSEEINLQNLSSGIYIARVRFSNNIYSQRIVVIK